VITELINLELYRRDFKFLNPVFKKEEEDDLDHESIESSG
jgi:hypothetical protein